MEGSPKNENIEKVISPEEFFDKNLEISRVSREEFIKIVKERNPNMDEDKIIQAKGINFSLNGKTIILLRTDIFPEKYLPYLETHEKWEAYIARKNGFNLWDRTIREYKKGELTDLSEEEDQKKFFKELEVYNYEFRHEYAIYKEYQQALKDGKLDEYHKWFMQLRENEKVKTSEDNLILTENDTEIRMSIYNKLKYNTPHLFLKK